MTKMSRVHNWFTNLSLLALGALFCVNALFFQAGEHPAPLISGRTVPEDTREIRLVSVSTDTTPVRENPVVQAVQTELKALGYYEGEVDGLMGAQTRTAIETYESDSGLPATGEPTPKLVSHIRLRNEERASSRSSGQGPTAAANEESRDAIAALIASDDSAEPPLTPGADEEIRTLQFRLKELGFDPGPIDGVLGEGTKRALAGFQESRGLEATGEVDARVLQAIFNKPGQPDSSGG